MKVLECSSKGDKRFSAFYAQVTVNGVLDSIENHYQLSKRFGEFKPSSWRDAKGRRPTHFVVGDKSFDMKYFSMWYTTLWLKYLRENPDLLAYINQFDRFTDMFKGKALNCQADVMQSIHDKGYLKVLHECQPFIQQLSKELYD